MNRAEGVAGLVDQEVQTDYKVIFEDEEKLLVIVVNSRRRRTKGKLLL
jgi:hypothetical protein